MVTKVKLQYKDELRSIPSTAVKEELGRLMVFNEGAKVADFPMDSVESYSLEIA